MQQGSDMCKSVCALPEGIIDGISYGETVFFFFENFFPVASLHAIWRQ